MMTHFFISVILQSNTIEVIDLAMEKVWNIGEDDVFMFLLNMMKKDVVSVNYQVIFFCNFCKIPVIVEVSTAFINFLNMSCYIFRRNLGTF